MRVYEFVIAIIALSFLFRLLHTRMTMKHEEKRGRNTETADSELREQLAALEERIRVLERIVTDRKSGLRQQFDDLGS